MKNKSNKSDWIDAYFKDPKKRETFRTLLISYKEARNRHEDANERFLVEASKHGGWEAAVSWVIENRETKNQGNLLVYLYVEMGNALTSFVTLKREATEYESMYATKPTYEKHAK